MAPRRADRGLDLDRAVSKSFLELCVWREGSWK